MIKDWEVIFHEDFDDEFEDLSLQVQDCLLAYLVLLAKFGPMLGRPHVDTLKNSNFKNMKELRFDADGGVWRVAFAFDPLRKAIILVAGDKSGVGQSRFYKEFLKKADKRFKDHIAELVTEG